jgi:hypothetical protein
VCLLQLLGGTRFHAQGDEPLLGAVVQVALDAFPFQGGCTHRLSTRPCRAASSW